MRETEEGTVNPDWQALMVANIQYLVKKSEEVLRQAVVLPGNGNKAECTWRREIVKFAANPNRDQHATDTAYTKVQQSARQWSMAWD
eukprot:g37051.t1